MLKAPLLIAATENLGRAFSAERWAYAGRMTLLGMVMIFAVLGLLWAVLAIFKLVMAEKAPKAKEEKPVATPAPVAEEESVLSDDGELVAVIAAAIAAYRASDR